MTSLREDIEAIYREAVAAVRADVAVRTVLRMHDGGLSVGDHRLLLGSAGVYLIAIGKASVAMIDAAADVLGDSLTAGLAVTKSEKPSLHPRIETLMGSHPVPDHRSLDAGEAVLHFAASAPDRALVLCLISGGGSALVESLREGVDLEQLREVTQSLLRGGASIHELNAVRSRFSLIKAGGLLRALVHAEVCNIIVSDVLGDDLHTIASGPTVPPAPGDAGAVLKRYDVAFDLPAAEDIADPDAVPTVIAANVSTAIDAAAAEAAARGFRPVVLSRSVDGEARDVGRMFAAMVADGARGLTAFGDGTCLLAGGETTVTVRGSGTGGRNTEAALTAAIRLAGLDGVAVGMLATDGDDGTSGVAGGIVDGATVDDANLNVAWKSLANNDSYTFLNEHAATLRTGPTGTNVNDLMIGLIRNRDTSE